MAYLSPNFSVSVTNSSNNSLRLGDISLIRITGSSVVPIKLLYMFVTTSKLPRDMLNLFNTDA